jgi:hypothetical protein
VNQQLETLKLPDPKHYLASLSMKGFALLLIAIIVLVDLGRSMPIFRNSKFKVQSSKFKVNFEL